MSCIPLSQTQVRPPVSNHAALIPTVAFRTQVHPFYLTPRINRRYRTTKAVDMRQGDNEEPVLRPRCQYGQKDSRRGTAGLLGGRLGPDTFGLHSRSCICAATEGDTTLRYLINATLILTLPTSLQFSLRFLETPLPSHSLAFYLLWIVGRTTMSGPAIKRRIPWSDHPSAPNRSHQGKKSAINALLEGTAFKLKAVGIKNNIVV